MRQRLGFRHSHDFVVVRPIRLTDKVTLWPGTKIDKKEFRRSHLRSLWRRGRIAIEDTDFSNGLIEKFNLENPSEKKAAPKKAATKKVASKKAAPKKVATKPKSDKIDFGPAGGANA